jgi:PAS domain S-box-containing protein
MRLNEPITDREVLVPEDVLLVSGTDGGGRIRFANAPFVEVSGFATAELEGAPHNIVRHPHMPKAAFADLWACIKAGRPWEGLVKNRTRSGDFYWVRANVTPTMEGGQVTGYVSIRTRPGREEVAEAEAAYARLREGGGGYALRDGELVRTGWRARAREALSSVTARMAVAGGAALLALAAVGWLGVAGMRSSNDGLHSVYEDRVVPALRLPEIRDLLRENIQQVALMPAEIHARSPMAPRVAAVRANAARVTELWGGYRAATGGQSAEEARLAERLAEARARFLREGLEPALALAERNDADALERQLREGVIPLFGPLNEAVAALSERNRQGAAALYAEAEARYDRLFWTTLATALAGVLVTGWLCAVALSPLRRPLREVERHLAGLARGDYQTRIAAVAAPEFRTVVGMLRALRARLAYAAQEREEIDRRAALERAAAVREMAETVERETRTAVQAVAQRTGAMAGQAQEVAGAAGRLGETPPPRPARPSGRWPTPSPSPPRPRSSPPRSARSRRRPPAPRRWSGARCRAGARRRRPSPRWPRRRAG